MKQAFFEVSRTGVRRSAKLVISALALGVLVACGGDDEAEKPASQVAAKVNKEELSVHQLNYVLQRQPGLQPEETPAASRHVLERLIDQELALQRAEETKIDRSPRVMQAMEAARREIISRAYLEKLSEEATKPTPEEIRSYYDGNPALFKERRIFSFQEIAIEAKPEQADSLRKQLESAKTVNEFLEYLKANDIRFAGSQAVRAAEQLPLNRLPIVAKMKDGESMFNVLPNGSVQVIVLAGSRSQPVDLERATPAIEQFLLNERKRKLIEEDVKAMRAGAKIEYVGAFAKDAASAPQAPVAAPAAQTPASAGLDIEKGLRGLK
ncbi:MAG: peptidyl-prolyl cis-trans isomerase, EpsD family [Methylibium sp.]|uniref:EpsD family peptidyl-prolyl cis-trans isomerase n=1 Tax=Methylibium sp. TaxID=2067992 RepID=UPI0017D3CC65|nr:EpsD family peptidyl-prolyl cis-trans isomerase [Methylibium sp.]MBA3597214.1 peptidyl-prolyl cis-trans isomerase, EpsD family [Methylibium sp.]